MTQDNNNTEGQEVSKDQPTLFDSDNVVSFEKFKNGQKDASKSYPTSRPGEITPAPVTASDSPPVVAERRILLNLTGGHKLVIDGFLAISGTFLAVGDPSGRIKFAAGPGMWEFATDVTGDPDYDDRVIQEG